MRGEFSPYRQQLVAKPGWCESRTRTVPQLREAAMLMVEFSLLQPLQME